MAQSRAFARKMPTFLGALAITLLGSIYAFHGAAPLWLTAYIPGAAALLAALRARSWHRKRHARPDDREASRNLRRASIVQIVLSLGLAAWMLAMSAHLTTERLLALTFMYTTCVMTSIYCLMHLRAAVLTVCGSVLLPLLGLLLSQGTVLSTMVALNLVSVFAAIITATFIYNKDFARLARANLALHSQRRRILALSDENLRLASLDALTGLANRRRLFDDLNALTRSDAPDARELTLGIVDLDGFKPINDTLGHALGDEVLREFAARLIERLGKGITAYRMGGDEFAFAVFGDLDDEKLVALGDQIIGIARLPMQIGSLTTSVGCSVGFARHGGNARLSATGLYERADFALYHAKRTGRGKTVIFSSEHERIIGEQSRVEQALRCADLEAELRLNFQPIVHVATGSVLAFEALARWQSPVLGPVSPLTFIAVAERAGLIGTLTPVLLRKALRAARSWPDGIRLSFNLSAHDIASRECILGILAIVSSEPFDPKRIDFEITETALAVDFDAAKHHLDMLKLTGAQIALDDFGTGFSSLSRVNALPLDKIKVDRSFVVDLDEKDSSRKIVSSVAALCRDMGLGCVIEGVETVEQQTILSDLGADVLQGYLYSKPMPEDQLAAFLSTTRSLSRQPNAA